MFDHIWKSPASNVRFRFLVGKTGKWLTREGSLSHCHQTYIKPPSSTEDGKGCVTQPLASHRACMLGMERDTEHTHWEANSNTCGIVQSPTAWPMFRWRGDLPVRGDVMKNMDYYKMDLEENLDLPEMGQRQEHSKEGHQDEWRLIGRNVLCGFKNIQLGCVRESWAISLAEGEHGYWATYFGLRTVEDGKPEQGDCWKLCEGPNVKCSAPGNRAQKGGRRAGGEESSSAATF